MISPLIESYKAESYNPYKYQNLLKPHQIYSRTEVDYELYQKKNGGFFLKTICNLPVCVRNRALNKLMDTLNADLKKKRKDIPEILDLSKKYSMLCFQRLGKIPEAMLKVVNWPTLLIHPMTAEDRLGNPNIKFPIGAVYGDQDYMSSNDSTEDLCKQNVNYESGRSQIFLIENASHVIPQEKPKELSDMMKAFFEGTVTHTW